jgi:hypothetical protein
MPAATEPVIPAPNPNEDDVTISLGNGQSQQIFELEDEARDCKMRENL